MTNLKLSQFDLYGIFRLKKDETTGIENLVHKFNHDEYLSRNANYYPNTFGSMMHFCDAYNEYAQLNTMLPLNGKPAFVICEKMHELAVRVVNTIQQQKRINLSQDGKNFDTVAQKCVQECADNLVRLLHHQTAEKVTTKLSEETYLQPDSILDDVIIEADNKKQLYMCANALPENIEYLITPGRGSSKLGALVQSVRKSKGLKPIGFTQIYYSLYKNEQYGQIFSQPLSNLPEKILVMDDDIDTGRTLSNIKKELTQQGHQVTNGAMFTTFYGDPYFEGYGPESVFNYKDWSNYIDIIPNQYAKCINQIELNHCLLHHNWSFINELTLLLKKRDNGDCHNTADYYAMKKAEKMANKFGTNLYQVSEKISPAAVEYNQKFRAQVELYNLKS